MPDFRGSDLLRVRELCRKLKPILGSRMDRLYMAYTLEDEDGKKQLETYLEALSAKHLPFALDQTLGDLVPPDPSRAAGPYQLGTVLYAGKPFGPFGLREYEWIQHVGIFGRSGAGKTNLGFEAFRQLVLAEKPVLVLDWKRNYRDLLARPEFENVLVYTLGRDVAPFSFNPLIPPQGTDPRNWLKQINEVIAHAYCLGNGVLYLLMQSIDAVYQEFGVYDDTVSIWPTFRDVLAKAKERNARGRESAWLSSTLRALASMCFGQMDQTLNQTHDQADAITGLLKQSVILEMDALGQSDKVFLTSALLLYIHHHRMAEGEREHFKHAILIEEAHHVLSNERRSLIGGQSVMEITFREIREFGEAILALDQHPSKISISALGNTYCTICLNLKHQKDVNAMAQSMLLESEEKDILGSLEVGQAVVKLQGRTTRPFLIQVPEFSITKGTVTDQAVRLRMADHVQHFVSSEGEAEPGESKPAAPLSEMEQDFVRDVKIHPDSGIAARYDRLGISVRQGQKLKALLVERGILEEEEVITGTGRQRVVRLTEKMRG